MRGTRAKRIRKIAAQFEPHTVKHGQRMYLMDYGTGQIVSVGFRAVYQMFKKTYKKLRREKIDDYITENTSSEDQKEAVQEELRDNHEQLSETEHQAGQLCSRDEQGSCGSRKED